MVVGVTREPRSLAAVTCLFNPGGDPRRAENYRRFAADLCETGMPLYVIEAVWPGQDFSLQAGPRVKQVYCENRQMLWQKERLLNLLVASLPAEVDSIAWLDADVLLDAWELPELILLALTRYPVIQLWQYAVLLDGQGQQEAWPSGLPAAEGVAAVNFQRAPADLNPRRSHPGFGWAMRRETWDAIGGLYECHLAGSADGLMAAAWLDHRQENPYLCHAGVQFRRHALAWCERAARIVRGDVGYLPIYAYHLWHGPIRDRHYWWRSWQLFRHGFDPGRDLIAEPGLPLSWSDAAPERLVAWWQRYLTGQHSVRQDLAAGEPGA